MHIQNLKMNYNGVQIAFELDRIKFEFDSRQQMKVTVWITPSTRRVLYLSTVFPYLSPSGDICLDDHLSVSILGVRP